MTDDSQNIPPGSYTAATLPKLSPKAQLLWDELNRTAPPLNTDTANLKPARIVDNSPRSAVRIKD